MEAEVKSEATGGRVNVETKDQKVWLPLSQGDLPCPQAQLPSSALCIKGNLGAYKGERLVPAHQPLHDTISLAGTDGARSRAAAHEPTPL